MEYYAHRGIIKNELENSKEAIINSLESEDYNGIEIDLRLSQDKEIILVHDENTSRISNEIFFISELKYDLLEKVILKDNSSFLTLNKFIHIYKSKNKYIKKKIIFDIKCNEEYIINQIIRTIKIFKIPIDNIIILTWRNNIPCYLYREINIFYAINSTVIGEGDILLSKIRKYNGICLKFDNSIENIKCIQMIKLLGLKTNVYCSKKYLNVLKLHENII